MFNKYILKLTFIYLEIKLQRVILCLLIRDTLIIVEIIRINWISPLCTKLNLLPVIIYSTGMFIELGRIFSQYLILSVTFPTPIGTIKDTLYQYFLKLFQMKHNYFPLTLVLPETITRDCLYHTR